MATAAVRAEPDIFFDKLRRATSRALLLNYAGVVAPLAVSRGPAMAYPRIPDLLDCIMSTCQTRVVLISNRPARELARLLGLGRHPEIWGTHGLEHLDADGRYERKYLNVRGKKGAVRAILSELGPDAAVAYIGDDARDEEVFRALHGHCLTVLVQPVYRFTAAQMWLRSPSDVLQFLVDWLRACGGDM